MIPISLNMPRAVVDVMSISRFAFILGVLLLLLPSVARAQNAPVANPDAYTVNEDETLSVTAPGVLGNDSDADGDLLTAILVGGVSSGTLDLRSDGSFEYTPDLGFTGTDSFTYQASDGTETSAETTVTLSVNARPNAFPDSYFVEPNTTLTVDAPGVLGNDSDPDGDGIIALLDIGPSNGTLEPRGSDLLQLTLDGAFTYTPDTDFIGTDSFTYVAEDDPGARSDTVTVSITVNAPPAANDDAYRTNAGDTLVVNAPGVLFNDEDPEGDAFFATLESRPSNGQLVPRTTDLLEVTNDGAFTYVPNDGFTGTDSFTYLTVAENNTEYADGATVTITVNGAPTAQDDAYQVSEGDTLRYLANVDVLANDSDPDGDALDAILVSEPTNGELLPLGSDNLLLTLDGDFTYVPNSEFVGVDTFRYLADDGSSTDTATVAITVNGRPIAVPDAYAVATNETLEVTAPGVLANDTDPEGDELFALVDQGPSNGVLVPQGTDNLEVSPEGGFTYVPDTDFSGIDTFTYLVRDTQGGTSTAQVSITVGASCSYTAVDLGTLGGSASRALDINEAGEIVGLSETSDGDVRGFIWSGGEMTSVAADQISQTFAVDEDIAGTADVGGTFQAVRFSGTETVNLQAPGSFSVALDTRERFAAGVYVEDDAFQPFVYDGDTGFAALPVPDGSGGQAVAVNLDGLVAGYSLSGQALLWSGGTATNLGPGRAYSISDRGEIVGSSNERAVMWAFDGTQTVLGENPDFAEAYGINGDGDVVGSSLLVTDTTQTASSVAKEGTPTAWATTSDPVQMLRAMSRAVKSSISMVPSKRSALGEAYLYRAGQTFNLNACVSGNTGWVLEEARAINDLGQIVGFGLLDGEQRAFLLNPGTNEAPVAGNDQFGLTGQEPIDLDLLTNDRDTNGDTVRVARIYAPEQGAIRESRGGTLRYYPPTGYSGTDRFSYVVTDGKGATARAHATIDILAPEHLMLDANAPNPFRDRTTIQFSLPDRQHVRLDVYDVLGRRVRQLVNGALPAGQHEVVFDADGASSGVYFYRMRAGGYTETRKMVVVQ